MVAAGIDVGTNTILMVIADVDRTGGVKVLEDVHAIPRLGQELGQHGAILKVAVERAGEALRNCRNRLSAYGTPPLFAVATAALRNASNGDKTRRQLESELGAPIHVISGQQEAALTFAGSTFGISGSSLVIDIGGGSTELVRGTDGRPHQAVSLPIGSVLLSEMYCAVKPVPAEEQVRLRSHIREVFSSSSPPKPPTNSSMLVAVAGTATSLAMLDAGIEVYNQAIIEDYQLTTERVFYWADRLLGLSLDELQAIPGLDPRRADVLPAGVAILAEFMDLLGTPNVRVSVRGLRFGALLVAAGLL
jgi:exopolyphosphatase/guanosine-5'-triphosphate,3'-diphosphate pyrophosphatase